MNVKAVWIILCLVVTACVVAILFVGIQILNVLHRTKDILPLPGVFYISNMRRGQRSLEGGGIYGLRIEKVEKVGWNGRYLVVVQRGGNVVEVDICDNKRLRRWRSVEQFMEYIGRRPDAGLREMPLLDYATAEKRRENELGLTPLDKYTDEYRENFNLHLSVRYHLTVYYRGKGKYPERLDLPGLLQDDAFALSRIERLKYTVNGTGQEYVLTWPGPLGCKAPMLFVHQKGPEDMNRQEIESNFDNLPFEAPSPATSK